MTAPTIYTGQPITRTQPAGASRPYLLDLSLQSVPAWQPDVAVAAGALVRPTFSTESVNGLDNSTGLVYQNNGIAAQTGALEPAWAKTGTVSDGSVTWTPATPPASGQDTIQSVTWTQQAPPDATLTITSQTNSSLVASAHIGGGTSGNVYTVVVSVTMTSGAIYPVEIFLTIL